MTEDQGQEARKLVTEALEQCTKARNQIEAVAKRLMKVLRELTD